MSSRPLPDVPLDLDVGEIVDGHHVVLRGLRLRPTGGELDYAFVPGITKAELDRKGFLFWYWMLLTTDDVGTEYDHSNQGVADTGFGGPASPGERDLGGVVPDEARRLVLTFEPPGGWTPPGAWYRTVVVDLVEGVIESAERATA